MTRRGLVRGMSVVVAVGLAILLALPWCDVLLGNVVPVLQALTNVWVILAVVAFVGALCSRRAWAVLAFTPAFVLALAASWLLTTSGAENPGPADRGPHRLTVLSLNAEFGEADAAQVMRLVRERKPDILVFVEMTRAKIDDLDQRGLRTVLPHRTSGMVDDGSRGSIIVSRWPLATLEADSHLGPYDLQSPVARVAAPGGEVQVRAVHSYPPLQDGVSLWEPQLRRLRAWQEAHRDERIIMAGDYNASVAHPAFRTVREGMLDAVVPHRTAAWPTWPHGSWVPPFVQIDHILTRGFASQAAGIENVDGTDHAACWATLRY